jgi:DNA-binding GntR family transcriptional regulator
MTVSQLSKTRHGQVYESLRADILSGRVAPGTKLPFAQLSERYGFSVGVIREALSRLVEQRLVENLPQQGFRVTSISKEDLMALTQARCEIEALTLKHSMQEGDTAWQSEVLAAHFRLANTPSMDSSDPERLNEEWVEVHNHFHSTLLNGCNNKRLTDICAQLRDSAELYRQWSARIGEAKKRDIAAEHQAIADAVLAGDTALATKLLKDHIDLTSQLLLESGFVEDM